MMSDIPLYARLMISFLPFLLFAVLNGKANVKKAVRCRQYLMPVVAVIYGVALMIFMDYLSALCLQYVLDIAESFNETGLQPVGDYIWELYETWGVYLEMAQFVF